MSTFTFDAWAGKTEAELKDDCRRLSREISNLTHLLMAAVSALPRGHMDIPGPERSEVWRRISYAAADEYYEMTGAPRDDANGQSAPTDRDP